MEKEEIEIFKIFKDNRHHPNGALWEVSNLGNVRKNGKEFLPYEGSGKYLHFGHNYRLHRAVAELFIPNPENKPTVDHKNRCIHDNRACNLRWATYEEQNTNRDNDAIRKSLIGNKRSLGYKNFLGHKHTEEAKVKMRASKLGNKNALGCKRSEDTKAKLRAAAVGNKNTLGKVWVTNPTTEHSTMVNPSELNDYFAKGYVRGMKQRNKEIMKS